MTTRYPAPRHKLRPPPRRSDHVQRPELAQRLLRMDAGAWAMLSAPIGYGKSTLAAEVARSSPHPVAWLSVDPTDDLTSVAGSIAAAVDDALVGVMERTHLALSSSAEPAAVGLGLLDDFADLEAALLLVVDDLHASPDPEVARVLVELATHAPAGLRSIFTTQSEPPAPLQRMRATGVLIELRAEELAFDAPTTSQLIAARTGTTLGVDAVDRIRHVTGGWPLAVQVVAASLSRGVALDRCLERLARHSDLVSILADEVLALLPVDLRRAVLMLAPLGTLSSALCEAVVEGIDGEALLGELDRANSFLAPTDDTRSVYVVHPVWAKFVRERSIREIGPDAAMNAYRLASLHCESIGDLRAAIEHAVVGGDLQRAAGLLQRHGLDLLARGDGHAVLGWIASLAERGRAAPLLVVRGWALVVALRLREATATAASLLHELDPDDTLRGHAFAIQAVVAFADGDLDNGERLAAAALGVLAPSDPAFAVVCGERGIARASSGRADEARDDLREAAARGRGSVARGAEWFLAELDLQTGDLRSARRRHLDAVARDADACHPSRAAIAELAREAGAFDDAVREIDAYVDAARARGSGPALLTGLIGRARVMASVARFDVARDHLADAVALTDLTQLRGWSATISALQAFVALREFVSTGDQVALADARSAHARAIQGGRRASAPAIASNMAHEMVEMLGARLELVQGVPGPCVDALPVLRDAAVSAARMRSVLELDLLIGIAERQRGGVDRLSAAVAGAEAAGFITLSREDQAILSRLVAAPPGGDAPPSGVLSRRELEVLNAIASGLSTADAARRLHVSRATVKKHLENIYGRLQVGSRMQAVAAARGLGLIA